MYPEFEARSAAPHEFVLALDWDETTGDYPLAFARLASHYPKVLIVTVNDELTQAFAAQVLGVDAEKVAVHCCPDEALDDVPQWKANVCLRERVHLMFDDNEQVVQACHALGVAAICVRERTDKFERN